MKTVPCTPYTDSKKVTKCGRTIGPTPVIVHENPAAFLRLFLKYVLMASEEADTLIPMPKPTTQKHIDLGIPEKCNGSRTHQKVRHMRSCNREKSHRKPLR